MGNTLSHVERITNRSLPGRTVTMPRDALPGRLRPDANLGVLDITEWFGDTSGGIRTYLLQKAEYVAARPWLRHVLTVPGAHDAIADHDGVRMYRLQGPPIPYAKPYRFMLATRSVSRIVRHERPDIIEIGSPFIVPWIVRHATRHLDVPMVCFYHTSLPRMFAPRASRGGVIERGVYRSMQGYMRRLDRLFPLTIVSSDYSARELAAEGITRVAKVPLGVDLEQFNPRRRDDAAATRRRFGLPDGLLAGFAGRFAREKDIDVVLDAWPEVERRTGARLVLIGAGPIEAALRAHPYAPRVYFLPFQTERAELASLLAALDVYVAPGPLETFGLSGLEALASGTPVLTVDVGGVDELVASSGAGRAYRRREPDSLAAEAEVLFASRLAMMGTAGRMYAEAEHSWDTVFDRLFAVYRTVLADRPA